MVFESVNSSFGGISAMNSGWNMLKSDILFLYVELQNGRAFIIEALEPWTKAHSKWMALYATIIAVAWCGVISSIMPR